MMKIAEERGEMWGGALVENHAEGLSQFKP